MRRCVVFVIVLLASSAAPAKEPKPDLLRDLRALFDSSPERLKQNFNCYGEWTPSGGTTPAGKRYTSFKCRDPEGEFSVQDGAVLMLGVRFGSQTFDRAREEFDARVAQLKASRCAQVTAAGQMAIFDCPGGDAVGVMLDWDSKTDTHSTKAFIGRSATLLPSLGFAPVLEAKRKPASR